MYEKNVMHVRSCCFALHTYRVFFVVVVFFDVLVENKYFHVVVVQ